MDRPLDETTAGPFYLRQPELADKIVEAIHYNHVHLLVTPVASLPKINQAVKGITAKRANLLLALTGRSFWQEESYDCSGPAGR